MLALILFLGITTGAGAQQYTDLTETPVATVRTDAGQVVWQPQSGVTHLSLRVTGPEDFSLTEEFVEGRLPVFRAQDVDGNALPDGDYNYEIWEIAKNPAVRSEPTEAQEASRNPENRYPIQSGTFKVLNGSIVVPNLQEAFTGAKGPIVGTNAAAPDSGLTPMDQVFSDDLIVIGSACVGTDCVNNETFGLETLLLKENDLRIRFEDTSTGGSPTHDWQLTANDSGSGGAEKFSIENLSTASVPFTVAGSAPTNSIYVGGGTVGFFTSTPSNEVRLHASSADTPALRLEQTGVFFPAQTWDIGGYEGSFFIRDITGGATLPFQVRAGAPSSSIDIAGNGDIGIGTNSPNGRFHIVGTDNPRVRLEDTVDNANDKPGLAMKSPASNGGGEWRFETDNAGNFQIDYSLSAGPEIVIIDDPVNNGQVKINGNLVVQGTCTGCDAVFQSGYPLESIEEHASLMWANSYLPAVGPTPEGKTAINVFEKTTGILQELEKAHIYIAQLDEEKRAMEKEQSALRTELAELRALVERLLANTPTGE